MIRPQTLAESVADRATKADCPLLVFWYSVVGDRDAFAAELEQSAGRTPLLPVVLRDRRFEAPNALMADLCELIREQKARILRDNRATDPSGPPIVILLISRSHFALTQASSPLCLPEWFPKCAGTTVTVPIEDLTHSADAPLNTPEAAMDQLREAIYGCEKALLTRLGAHAQESGGDGDALHRKLNGETSEVCWADFLQRCTEALRNVHSPSGYRPSARDQYALAGRIMATVSKETPDRLDRVSSDLARALGVRPDSFRPVPESMPAVIARSTNRNIDPCQRFARNILVSMYAACQYTTAAAHADQYPRYPISLIRSTSLDLREVLAQLTYSLEEL